MNFLVTTTFNVEGFRIKEYKGIVRGIILRKSLYLSLTVEEVIEARREGVLSFYTQMCEKALQQAYDALVKHAVEMGANAIIGMRYDATYFAEQHDCSPTTEVLAYGTAVVLEKDQ